MSSKLPKHVQKWWFDPWLENAKAIDLLQKEKPQVLILGAGAGGAFAACTLAEAGVDVVVIEKGFHYGYYNAPKNLAVAVSEIYEEGGFRSTYHKEYLEKIRDDAQHSLLRNKSE